MFEFLQMADLAADDIRYKCLEAVLAQSPNDLLGKSKIVDITRFGQVCAWFGPLEASDFLDKVVRTLKEKWFHGDVTQEQAEDRLTDQPKGSFLVRFSSSAPGCFTISHISKKQQLCHQRVTYIPSKGFEFWNVHYQSLRELIKEQRKKHYFVSPCGGSPYQKIFPKKKKSSKKGQAPQPEGGVYMVHKPAKS